MLIIIQLLFSSLVIPIALTNPLSEKIKIYNKLIIAIVTLIMTALMFYFPEITFLKNSYIFITLSFSIVFLIIITKNKLINVIAALAGYITAVVVNYLELSLIYLLFKIDNQQISSDFYMQLLFSVINFIVVFTVTKAIGKAIQKQIHIINKRNTLLILIDLVLCVSILVFNITYGNSVNFPVETIIFNCILFCLYFIVSLLLMKMIISETKKNLSYEKEIELHEAEQKYTKSLESVTDELRSFRHDYINILLTLDEMINSDDNEQLKAYFEEHIKPTVNHINFPEAVILSLANIKDTYLKSIINTKLNIAFNKNIKIVLEVKQQIEINGIDPVDLARVIGILIDNAIEASEETEHPFINIALSKRNTITMVCIQNSTIANNIPINYTVQKDFSTKGKDRGLGLYQANKIIEKYPNIVRETSNKHFKFTQKLIIYDKNQK